LSRGRRGMAQNEQMFPVAPNSNNRSVCSDMCADRRPV
jgi:hypothetical protein